MPVAQFAALIRTLPHIESVLKTRGEAIPRPDYDIADLGGGGGEPPAKRGDGGAVPAKAGRKNFEETSEEED
jgi:hypothetical protein